MKPMNTTVRFAASLKFNVEGGRKRKANIPGREREGERERERERCLRCGNWNVYVGMLENEPELEFRGERTRDCDRDGRG
jgi:hypothetical protein